MKNIDKLIKYRYDEYKYISSRIYINYNECKTMDDIIKEEIKLETELLNQALFISFSKLFNIYFFENELVVINDMISKKLLDDIKLELIITNYNKYKRVYNSADWIIRLFNF